MAIPKTYEWNNNGTKQGDRLPKALSGDYVKIDERSFDDLLSQMAEYAKRLVYFNDNMNQSGDWTEFFKDVYDYDKHELKKDRIEALSEAGDMPPHIALMMAFLKMFEVQQHNLNTLTERHLQFYYKDILGFKPREGENGKATVFFEPVKNAPEAFIPQGTLFDAGKDANGKPITYRSVRDVTVNQMKVTETKRLPIESAEKADFGLIITHPSLPFLENEEKQLVSTSSDKLNITFGKDNIVITVNDSKDLSILSELMTGSLSIKVTNSKNFVMENAQGALANQTGTMPFGPKPKNDDYFTIKVPLANNCSIDDVHDNWNDIASTDIIKKEKNTKLVLDKDIDWTTYTSELKSYIDYLKGSSSKTATMPHPPQAPSLKEPITIDYTIPISDHQKQYFSPFGTRVVDGETTTEITQMLEKQALCLKLEGLQETCVLTLHFEMNPFKFKLDGKYGENVPVWHYYTTNGWTALADTDIISDTTNRFRRSGIVQLQISDALVKAAKKGTASYLWLMVEANTSSNPFEAFEAVRAQAVEVELDPQSEGQMETGGALPANTIVKTKTSIKGIKKIEQSYIGEEGRKTETDASFYARVSEELRHKGRAWNRWDYERLVLERFPQIASVKCLSCYNCEAEGGRMEPGHVTLLAVPDLQSIPQDDELRPTIGKNLEHEITGYISQRAPSFVKPHVTSPTYKEAKVHCEIILREGLTDINYYTNLINSQLIRFFAPWTSPETPEIEFRTNQNESHVQAFIENLDCVDHFHEFKLTIGGQDIDCGMPLQPDDITSIITSAKQHEIKVLKSF
ncbi:MAG: baseplate J/gp47 family protein [Prevotella sp.]|nr:baseplate J/gp47 family protein [Prevotella sp.]